MINAGEIIRMCRNSLSWSQTYLSEKSNISVAKIRYAEAHTDCKVSVFEKLLDAMGYEVEIFAKEE